MQSVGHLPRLTGGKSPTEHSTAPSVQSSVKLVFLLLLCAAHVFGQTTAGTTNHYEVLRQEKMFCVAGGFSGAVTAAGHSLMAIARQKDAASVFTKLTREDSPTAQLFGLLGLRIIGADQFNNALAKLLKSKSEVTVLVGPSLHQ